MAFKTELQCAVEEAERDLAEGRWVGHSEVLAKLEQRMTEEERKTALALRGILTEEEALGLRVATRKLRES